MNRFEHLLVAEIASLRRYARALCRDPSLADDLVQECLTRAVGRRRTWIGGRAIRPWLFRILHNVFVDGLRRQASAPLEPTGGGDPETLAAEQDADLLCSLSDFEQALYQLSPEQREVLLLVGVEQMSYREAAKVTGVAAGTVMSRLSRARELLARGMDGNLKTLSLKRVK